MHPDLGMDAEEIRLDEEQPDVKVPSEPRYPFKKRKHNPGRPILVDRELSKMTIFRSKNRVT